MYRCPTSLLSIDDTYGSLFSIVTDDLSVIGLASRGDKDRLSVWFVAVRLLPDGQVDVRELESWQATRGTDDGSQLLDVHDAVVNAIDAKKLGKPNAVAVKRVETPRGRPSKPYD